ncbi:DNA-directed RNA polymerase subunit beta [Candidatus Parcubacteria bacterium]|nr:DNA-directed RNA polymerase subunit beta [Patescibacteria group bacterium]MCG2693781.1 DNA-directed RNA polymerase subunit beta [Candidatus Parcubacteria bacterium]
MQFKRLPVKSKTRKYFGKAYDAIPQVDLIEIQKTSYKWFLEKGIKDLFREISPIRDFIGRDLELYFDEYSIDEPKFDEKTAMAKNVNYEAPLRVKVRLMNRRTEKTVEQEIYLGEIPLMTNRGTFVVNGIQRVVVSQLIRSAGAFFTSEFIRGRRYYGAKIIPNRGAWMEFETDANGVIWVKIDRKRKVAVTTLLRVFGLSGEEEIKKAFEGVDVHPSINFIDSTLLKDLTKNQDDGYREVYKRIRPGDLATVENAKSLIDAMFFNFDRYDLGEVGRYKFNLRFGYETDRDEVAKEENRILSQTDLINIVKEIIRLNITQDEPDDIDHLGNRRVRAVGELVQNRFRVGLARMERIVKDRMSTSDIEALVPGRLVNARPVISAVREFFMSSQLSQFMDQTNPLSELEHKRRLSVMGPGGLSRERAGFEVRDVHQTHYGRICPIATPEGPNIGLVGHLASYARINEYGFLETPYRKIDKSGDRPRVTNEIIYLNAFAEEKTTTTPATTPIDENGYFLVAKTEVRRHGEPDIVDVNEIDYMDVSSRQIVSISTSLIPFLEHDDGNRALMGTNMQRQAVPIINPESPIVGTGVEAKAAQDSGHVILAEDAGTIVNVDGSRIQILEDKGNLKTYTLNKFTRSNHSTCMNQKLVIEKGQKVKKGDILADGPSTDKGELALGQNVLVTFLAWDGYNFEDAIILSDRIVQDDKFTSIHIENHTIDVRDTKLGPEIITNDIPNVSEELLKNLDEEGIIRIGAEVASGDILVGKITPKGETELSAEEKLLRAIFGEKARDVRDTSLSLEHGEHGKVVDIKIFSREAGDKLPPGVIKSIQVAVADLRKIQVGDKMSGRHGNKGVVSRVVSVEDMPYLEDGTPIDIILSPLGVVSRMNIGQILETHMGLAANILGYKLATPNFDGISEPQIADALEEAGFPRDGKIQLYDGRTGEPFDHRSTVGYKYFLKLNHLVEDKIHQRSIGPYSLITQQPLGGKAQFGGQRFGEMEVWALEAYGAAHTLQEILTIKSDDVPGRSKAYESIIKGEPIRKLNIPESFHVLLRELKGLCLDVELIDSEEEADEPRMGEGRPREVIEHKDGVDKVKQDEDIKESGE